MQNKLPAIAHIIHKIGYLLEVISRYVSQITYSISSPPASIADVTHLKVEN